jgi:PHD/YefM family antitoxin component YafN of YafNO toxin-antitoxin module
MTVVNTVDVRNNFRNLCLKAERGEKILIIRPKQKNLILVSEEEFIRLGLSEKEKPKSKYELLSQFRGIAKGGNFEKNDKDTLAESLVEKYESIT